MEDLTVSDMVRRLAWWLICVCPRFAARWLMFGAGQRVPLPASWVPYLFGRALGVDGRRFKERQ